MENGGKGSGWIIGIIILLILVGIASCSGGGSSDEFNEFDAQVVAEHEVKERLKAPSTADFSPHRETDITKDGNEWRVDGWVEAQNSFGATIRSKYTVKFTMTGADTYVVDYCYVD